jgi:hypothetical protein
MTTRYAVADNGDPVARDYEKALSLANARRISLGVCERRCSWLKNRKPLAFGWRGTSPASSHRCPVCGSRLKRMTHYRWAGCVQLLGLRNDRRSSPRFQTRRAAT